MSKGNYNFLTKITNVHTVTNYWKRLLRNMKQPLIPYESYELFMKILRPDQDKATRYSAYESPELKDLTVLKQLINQLPAQNFNTLKFHMKFFNKVVQNEYANKMTYYNISVTVGPNIFRPEQNTTKDVINVGMYYELMQRMMELEPILFDKSIEIDEIIQAYKNLPSKNF